MEEIGKWEKLKIIGKGGSSTVYKCSYKATGQYVAVKEIQTDGLSKEQIVALNGEVQTIKNLTHPNIIQYIGTQQNNNYIYIILEYADKGSLRQFYQLHGPLKESQVAYCTRQILLGLYYLHSKDIAHRDIKGANVLLTKKGIMKLADFGASKRFDTESLVSGLKGTPHWMAPEVIKGTQMTNGWLKADVWSIGCTIVELLTGRIPYHIYDNPMTAMYHIASGEPPPVIDVVITDVAKSFIQSCCFPNPDDRPSVRTLLQHPFVSPSPNGNTNKLLKRSKNAETRGRSTSNASNSSVEAEVKSNISDDSSIYEGDVGEPLIVTDADSGEDYGRSSSCKDFKKHSRVSRSSLHNNDDDVDDEKYEDDYDLEEEEETVGGVTVDISDDEKTLRATEVEDDRSLATCKMGLTPELMTLDKLGGMSIDPLSHILADEATTSSTATAAAATHTPHSPLINRVKPSSNHNLSSNSNSSSMSTPPRISPLKDPKNTRKMSSSPLEIAVDVPVPPECTALLDGDSPLDLIVTTKKAAVGVGVEVVGVGEDVVEGVPSVGTRGRGRGVSETDTTDTYIYKTESFPLGEANSSLDFNEDQVVGDTSSAVAPAAPWMTENPSGMKTEVENGDETAAIVDLEGRPLAPLSGEKLLLSTAPFLSPSPLQSKPFPLVNNDISNHSNIIAQSSTTTNPFIQNTNPSVVPLVAQEKLLSENYSALHQTSTRGFDGKPSFSRHLIASPLSVGAARNTALMPDIFPTHSLNSNKMRKTINISTSNANNTNTEFNFVPARGGREVGVGRGSSRITASALRSKSAGVVLLPPMADHKSPTTRAPLTTPVPALPLRHIQSAPAESRGRGIAVLPPLLQSRTPNHRVEKVPAASRGLIPSVSEESTEHKRSHSSLSRFPNFSVGLSATSNSIQSNAIIGSRLTSADLSLIGGGADISKDIENGLPAPRR